MAPSFLSFRPAGGQPPLCSVTFCPSSEVPLCRAPVLSFGSAIDFAASVAAPSARKRVRSLGVPLTYRRPAVLDHRGRDANVINGPIGPKRDRWTGRCSRRCLRWVTAALQGSGACPPPQDWPCLLA